MNNETFEFNNQLALDVLISGMTEITKDYVERFDWSSFDEIVIPKGVKSIGDSAFWGCNGLTNVTIPNNVTSIEDCAFYNCRNLMSIVIPESVKRIKHNAFAGCNDLTNMAFKGKTLNEVRSMDGYPWYIPPEKISVQVS